MKFGLFLALLVLLASTNVFGQQGGRKHRQDRTQTDQLATTNDGLRDPNKPVAVVREETKPVAIIHDADQPITLENNNGKPIRVTNDARKPIKVIYGGNKLQEVGQDELQPGSDESRRRPSDRDENIKPNSEQFDLNQQDQENVDRDRTRDNDKPVGGRDNRRPTDLNENIKSNSEQPDRNQEDVDLDRTGDNDKSVGGSRDRKPEDWDKERINRKPEDRVEVDENVRPGLQETGRRPHRHNQGSRLNEDQPDVQATLINGGIAKGPISDAKQSSNKLVHVSGNIILTKYRSSVVDSVQYDVDGTHASNDDRSSLQARLPYAQDFIARNSRVTLYVSTSKTTDQKSAFAQFSIKYKEDHFPLSFDIDVDLPSQQRGLLERADITLYFFVYITNPETRIDNFLPAGTSQILLQGTNRLVQKLDVYVRASGIEVSGLFRGRFGDRHIRSGTSFQVFIVPEQSLTSRKQPSLGSVAQSTINNAPALFPVPFSLLVHYQMLKPNTRYYAIGYVFENGDRRPINHEPILVINEQKALVTPQVIFNVVPSPFILSGTVTRSMPGSFSLQPHSSLILRLHQIGSNAHDIIFKLPEIITLPQVFQVNVSQAKRFDPSKDYDIRALITDGKNNIYMASLQTISLPDELSKLIVPVDDLLYYVQVRLQSSNNQPLNYIPGSTAQVFVTESPETPTKPIVSMRVDSIPADFRDFSIQVPATAMQKDRNYYLVMMIESNGIITHVSKTLLISNNQPPPLVLQLPVLSLNLVSGVLFDVENRPAQWSSSSYANLFLMDDKIENPEKSIVQVWKIHLENDFPVRFQVQLDFSRLQPNGTYRLQGAIESGRNLLEYKPAGSVLTLNPQSGIVSDVRLPVRNVKTSQLVKGLIYINDIREPLPEKSEVIVQLSSSPSLTNPSIIHEIRLKVDGRHLPINFTLNLPLKKIDINSVYYFLVQYIVRDNLLIPASQAFAFSPRNEATVVLTLSKTPQIPITGQVTSTGSPLILPASSTLHLYITDNPDQNRSLIYSEVFLQASSNSLYEFTMNIDSLILQKKIPLYLHADILYDDRIILSIPRPALLQITPGGEWNINLVIDLPTLLIGKILSMSPQEATGGELDVYIEIIERGTNNVIDNSHIRVPANLPQSFRIEIDNDLFARYPSLQARAVIKNCKGQVLFESGGAVNVQPGLNLKVDLPVVLTDRKKFNDLQTTVNEIAPLRTGIWRLSVTGVVSDVKNGLAPRSNRKSVRRNQ